MSISLEKILALTEEYLQKLPAMPPLTAAPSGAGLAGWIDHTILKPDATVQQVTRLCEEARQYHFATVCVNPSFVPLAANLLGNSGVVVCAVVGFPLGATFPEMKAAETLRVINEGATEVDTVINIGALKSGDYALALLDVQAVVQVAAGKAHVKVILEMCYLEYREKIIGDRKSTRLNSSH